MTKYINGHEVKAKKFGFDGCHKFYLIESDLDENKLRSYDYEIHDISRLPELWAVSCPLRFIRTADLTRCYVPQFEPAYFEGWFMDTELKKDLDELAREQVEANEGWED